MNNNKPSTKQFSYEHVRTEKQKGVAEETCMRPRTTSTPDVSDEIPVQLRRELLPEGVNGGTNPSKEGLGHDDYLALPEISNGVPVSLRRKRFPDKNRHGSKPSNEGIVTSKWADDAAVFHDRRSGRHYLTTPEISDGIPVLVRQEHSAEGVHEKSKTWNEGHGILKQPEDTPDALGPHRNYDYPFGVVFQAGGHEEDDDDPLVTQENAVVLDDCSTNAGDAARYAFQADPHRALPRQQRNPWRFRKSPAARTSQHTAATSHKHLKPWSGPFRTRLVVN